MQRDVAGRLISQRRSQDDMSEDPQGTFDNIPEQGEWRVTWINEDQDDEWTKRMKEEVNEKARSLLTGKVESDNLSCRETVCRMHLQFEDMLDAQTFTSAEHDPDLRYEYRLLNPDREEESPPGKKYNYEVLVKRLRPKNLPPNSIPK